MSYRTLPEYETDDFITKFERLPGPGFFPVHDGRFDGCRAGTPPRVVFFGSNWGTLKSYWECARDLRSHGQCGCPTSKTDRNLRNIVEEAGIDPCACQLTNAMLGLADVMRDTKANEVFWGHELYLGQCGKYHKQWLEEHAPRHAVIMGAWNLDGYGKFIWPELFEQGTAWHRATIGRVFSGDDPDEWNDVVTADSGLTVQVMYHPSFRLFDPPDGQLHWKTVREKTVAQLRRYGAGQPV